MMAVTMAKAQDHAWAPIIVRRSPMAIVAVPAATVHRPAAAEMAMPPASVRTPSAAPMIAMGFANELLLGGLRTA
jgi:hypothetical protein